MTETPFLETVPWQPAAFPADPAAAEQLREWLASEEYTLDGVERDFRGADHSGGDFSHCWFTDAVLVTVRLVGASLYRADLQSVNLTRADLTAADLVKANLDEAVLRSAVLDGADMVGGSLSEWTRGEPVFAAHASSARSCSTPT
ncbi:pentapeptide repeat-containing protein [Streptomyces sp. DT224]|uniref:pentapeptide repeat-containing protein n=1 Tax=Streptomyces sp. DT224 TaxID=3393426 RepID=UPI003CF0D867